MPLRAEFFIVNEKKKVKVLTAQSNLTLCDTMVIAHQAPLSMEF